MNVKIADLMKEQVVTAQPHHTLDHVRKMMSRNKVHVIPVVGSDEELHGIVSSSDLLDDVKGGSLVSQVMTKKVYNVPQYEDVHIAARVMRNHHVHHVVVTHEQKVVGILSAFDLLRLVEDHRFVMKGAPTPSTRRPKARR